MTVVVTMAGAGSRFRSQGYQLPKHMIRARGKTLFEWSIASLRNFYDQPFVFACLAEHDAAWIEKQARAMGVRCAKAAPRASLSLGQAHTAFDVLPLVETTAALWIYNIDTYIERGLSPLAIHGHHGCVQVFESTSPSMSFVRYDAAGKVVELAEKRVISRWATVGVYGFSSADLFRSAYLASYPGGLVTEASGERYVAPVYQALLNEGMSIAAPKLEEAAVHILGTPAEVLDFDPAALPPFGA